MWEEASKAFTYSDILMGSPLSFVFLIIAILTVLIVVLVCVSMMINDVEHVFIYLLVICIISLEKCLFKSFASSFVLAQDYLGYLGSFVVPYEF